MSNDYSPPVNLCPWCEDQGEEVYGKQDHRILLNGRTLYRCPSSSDHTWQDMSQKPDFSEKGSVVLRRA